MPSFSFIYRTRNNPTAVYTGKYVYEGNLDINQPIDTFIKKELITCLNNYRFNRGYREIRHNDINLGILSVTETTNFNSFRECKAFDFYFHNDTSFINGRRVNVSTYQSGSSSTQENKNDSGNNESCVVDNSSNIDSINNESPNEMP